MIKRVLTVCLIIAMFLTMIVQVYAVESGDYVMHELVQSVEQNGDSWTKFYHPAGYPNVWAAFRGNANTQPYKDGNTMYIYFLKDNTTITAGSDSAKFSQTVKYITVNSLAEMERVLFEGGTYDFSETTAGTAWSQSILYSAESDPSHYKKYAQSIDSYYYEYFYEKNGYYPKSIQLTINIWCNNDIIDTNYITLIAGDSLLLTDTYVIEEDYIFDSINVDGQLVEVEALYTFTKDTIINIIVEKDKSFDASGIIATLKEILEVIKSYLSFDYIKAMGQIWPDARDILSEKLASNKFYTSSTAIMTTLKELYSKDYTDAEGFYELGIFSLNLRTPEEIYYKNYGNETIGDWEVEVKREPLTVGGVVVDFEMENGKLLNLDWFFDKHYEDGTYTKGVKSKITDPFLSAWLWVMFGFWMWRTLPSIISGEIREINTLIMSEYRVNTQFAEKQQRLAEKQAEKQYKQSYEYYKENRDRNKAYNERYWKESRKK